jgi:hypothetical protein
MGLFTPAWKSKNREKARKAIERMTDQKKLVMAAKYAFWEVESVKAIEKIHDDDLLMEVFDYYFNSKRYYWQNFCKKIVEQLTNKAYLRTIVRYKI